MSQVSSSESITQSESGLHNTALPDIDGTTTTTSSTAPGQKRLSVVTPLIPRRQRAHRFDPRLGSTSLTPEALKSHSVLVSSSAERLHRVDTAVLLETMKNQKVVYFHDASSVSSHKSTLSSKRAAKNPFNQQAASKPKTTSSNITTPKIRNKRKSAKEVAHSIATSTLKPHDRLGKKPRYEIFNDSSSYRTLTPSDHDVLCGRGNGVGSHPGNIRFRAYVWRYRDAYHAANRNRKPIVAQQVLDCVRENGGRFVVKVKDSDCFAEASPAKSLEKACQALREQNWQPEFKARDLQKFRELEELDGAKGKRPRVAKPAMSSGKTPAAKVAKQAPKVVKETPKQVTTPEAKPIADKQAPMVEKETPKQITTPEAKPIADKQAPMVAKETPKQITTAEAKPIADKQAPRVAKETPKQVTTAEAKPIADKQAPKVAKETPAQVTAPGAKPIANKQAPKVVQETPKQVTTPETRPQVVTSLSSAPMVASSSPPTVATKTNHKAEKAKKRRSRNMRKNLPVLTFPGSELRPNDVISGRGNGCAGYSGNMKFRLYISLARDTYAKSKRNEKRKIGKRVWEKVYASGGRFVEEMGESTDTRTYCGQAPLDHRVYAELEEDRAVEKCCQALRELKTAHIDRRRLLNFLEEEKKKGEPFDLNSFLPENILPEKSPRAGENVKKNSSKTVPPPKPATPTPEPVSLAVGTKVSVFWPIDAVYYEATIRERGKNSMHYVEYGADKMKEWLDMSKQDFHVVSAPTRWFPDDDDDDDFVIR